MTAAHLDARAPGHLRVRERRALAPRLARGLAWTLLVIVAIGAATIAHLSMPIGRAAARDLVVVLVSGRTLGRWRVGEMTRLDFDGVELHDMSVVASGGERVLSADRMVGEFAFFESLRRGALVLTPCELAGGEMRLTRGPADQLALVQALEVPSDRAMIPLQLRDVHLHGVRIVLQLPGLPGDMEMANVSGLLDLTIGHEFGARLDQLGGTVNFPIVNVGFERLSGRIQSDDPRPLVVRLVLDLGVADPSMELWYSAPRAVGREGDPGVGIELGVDVPDPSGVARRRTAQSADAPRSAVRAQ